jgi:hypothetical protein
MLNLEVASTIGIAVATVGFFPHAPNWIKNDDPHL